MPRFRLSSLIAILLAVFLITANASAEGVIQLPKTGQTTSYYPGDDGALQKGVAWPNPRFLDNADGTVTDKLTGLMWTKNVNFTSHKLGWDVFNYVAGVNSGNGTYGYKDWRLPNIIEIESLVARGYVRPFDWLNNQGFSLWSNKFWTSTNDKYGSDLWCLYLQIGEVYPNWKDNDLYIWLVRSGQCETVDSVICLPATGQTISYEAGDDGSLQKGVVWPNPRFFDNSDGTVTDELTGLMWTKNANLAGTKTWQKTLDYVAGMNSGNGTYGYKDWRLPNIIEINSLKDYSSFAPYLHNPFINVQSVDYWSSSTYADYNNNVWLVNLWYGSTEIGSKDDNYYVLPVRGEQNNTPTAITLSSLTAEAKNNKVIIQWQTATEINNLGFNILRSESETGPYTKINKKLIKAKGSSTKGASYKFKDKNIETGKTYWYKLEDIDSNTGPAQHDAVKVEVTAKKVKAKK